MPHETSLIATIVIGLVLAFILGAVANRLKVSALVGYLLAGVLVGPFTPGFVADQELAPQLAEIGVILLMFGVGLHFSLKDLLSVWAIAVPGAIVQISFATLLGVGLSHLMGWSLTAGIVFGLALSVASTVVLLRALQERRLVETERGHIAIGWLIVEDLAMVLALVLLPVFADFLASDGGEAQGSSEIILALALTLGKVAAFVALMLIGGKRLIPWILHYIARTGSEELFRLGVLAISLGVAFGAAELFDVSFALGAFFAGMVLNESELSHEAAAETLPLRDAFAVLFFVSVGMLFDPFVLIEQFWPVLATFAIIVFGKSIAAFLILLAFRHSIATAFTISASLAQIGEFSFILAGLGMALEMLPGQANDLILAGAILSILANPLMFFGFDRLGSWLERRKGPSELVEDETSLTPVTFSDHAVIIGYGRVGSRVGQDMLARREPFVVIEDQQADVTALHEKGIEAIVGNGADGDMLEAANVAGAKWLFIAIPDMFAAGQIAEQAHALNPDLQIVARAHSDAGVEHLQQHGAGRIIMGEHEIARGMIEHVLGGTETAQIRSETGLKTAT
ncbi:MAG: YbaL family putative K(+) efflux transporter [Alphaproteobacteria bacterium]|jgi:monovalent cation:H+ antiporter-2, CPA2 family|nr:Kef family K(+) transporter [Rhodospirillaceae bacterium]MBT6205069.1 Kef family K(+) transporter [Rhodospirillaceae bacterium]MBT6511711.1 Kef family K(+) transporter [Rhodospirillaceae bacterium]MBT7646153.1 Kef family K(+) transporter [Rhodospirillaceae bacterium]MDG2480337.1 YbaL family putative K(+) efflux transporter [Alphaproteobacteria bacterium]